jgi:hypothetical protein
MNASCVTVIAAPWEQQQQVEQRALGSPEAMGGVGLLKPEAARGQHKAGRRQHESQGECWVWLAGCYSCWQHIRDIHAIWYAIRDIQVIWHAIRIKDMPQTQSLYGLLNNIVQYP